MKFKSFKSKIDLLIKTPLKGFEAQLAMAPKIRHRFSPEMVNELNPLSAAVICLFFPDESGITRFLLILRSSYEGTHASQVGFPGGKQDPEDKTLERTGLRELEEEVGIRAEQVNLIRPMTPVYIPPSNFLVTPFMALCDTTPLFVPNHEVAGLYAAKLSEFLDESCVTSMKVRTSYAGGFRAPCFELEGAQVWGATAMMLNEIRELLKVI
jgi:8-oxo-dGTP pyrophosphatase MutT (NUDIX family)